MTELPTAARARSDGIGKETPEWRPWLDRVTAALEEDASLRFDETKVTLATEPRADAPSLSGAVLGLPARAAKRWLAKSLSRSFAARHGLDALAFAIQDDRARLEALAVVAGEDGDTVAARASAAALPVLFAFRRRVERDLAPGWSRGSCPVCGGWPAFAESRGLERARRLRCGRCGADWVHAWLRCVFCGEADHRRQGSLVPESGGEARRVETCETCRGYVKTVATVAGFPAWSVPLEDLATVDLDVAAIDRGFRRPSAAVVPCGVVLDEGGS